MLCVTQWRSIRVRKACSARGPVVVVAQYDIWGSCAGKRDGALLEFLHTGALQSCYANGVT